MSKLYICSKCGKKKQEFDFYKNGKGLQPHCKDCEKLRKKIYRENNLEVVVEREKSYKENNREKVLDSYRRYNAEHADERREYSRNYQKEKPFMSAQRASKRRAAKVLACPKWLSNIDLAKIKSIYKMANNLSKKTGTKHHVDHIVPLQGKDVCGLHVPWNLQVLPAEENLRKYNKLIEDIV